MLVRLDPRLEDAICVVYPARIPLQAKEHLARRGGAVHAVFRRVSDASPRDLAALRRKGRRRVLHWWHAYKGALRVSSPARWSLWTWLRKQARGAGRAGLRRKKSTFLVSMDARRHVGGRKGRTSDIGELGHDAVKRRHLAPSAATRASASH